MKQALTRAARQSEKQQKTGPACGSEHLDLCGTRQQVLLTRVGRVELPLTRVRYPAH